MPPPERRRKDLQKKLSKTLPGQQRLSFAPKPKDIEAADPIIDLCGESHSDVSDQASSSSPTVNVIDLEV